MCSKDYISVEICMYMTKVNGNMDHKRTRCGSHVLVGTDVGGPT